MDNLRFKKEEKMKKIISFILAVTLMLSACALLASCGADGVDGKTPFIGENGNWWIGDTDLGVPATGPKGEDGKDGADGKPAELPYIGENGNWWIGDTDLGVPARGPKGEDGNDGAEGKPGDTPYIGENGNWWTGTTDTGVKAKGEDGKPGDTPYIGENGNWWIGDTDLGVPATGNSGTTDPDEPKPEEPRFRVLPEFIAGWYGGQSAEETDAGQEAGLTMEEIERLSREWGTPIEELMEQVEEI